MDSRSVAHSIEKFAPDEKERRYAETPQQLKIRNVIAG